MRPLYMCLIDTWGMLRGVSRSVEGVLTGWLSMCLSPISGWLSIEVPAGWCPRLCVARKRREHNSRIRFARCGLRI